MEVKTGYKQTEVGVIPVEWEITPFAELFAFRNGVNADKASYGQGVRFINVLEPITYSHIHGPEITGQVTLPETVIASYSVRRGDVLFNRTSETQEEVALAATYLGSERVVFGGFVIRGRPLDQRFDPVYSGYALRAPLIRLQIIPMGQGAIRANIGQQNLGLVVAPVPPVPEQRAIAEALSDVDELLGGLDRLITKKRDLKQAAMQQLLTGQSRLPGFHGQWEETTFGSVVRHHAGNSTLIKGKLPSSEATGRFPAYSASGQDVWCDHFEHEGDAIVVSAVGSRCGKAFKASGKWCAIANTHVVWPNAAKIDTRFLAYFINDEDFWQKSGTGQPFVLFTKTFARPLHLPKLSEQTAIADLLTEIDLELAGLKQRREKTRGLKQAMMQELLTGRTRLV
ncbi:MAG: hypothetical protein JWL59_3110 [Chthoniobacteraceae bacterium]|nr:hypothetical protein [Chthoniobacteraceae bacterium]